MSATSPVDGCDDHCCSAMSLSDRQAAAEHGFICSADRCARELLADLRSFDAILAELADGAR